VVSRPAARSWNWKHLGAPQSRRRWIRYKVPAFVKSRRRTFHAFIRGGTSRVKRRVYSKRREAEFRGVSFAIKIDTRSPAEEFTGNFDATDTSRRILINFGLIVEASIIFRCGFRSRSNLADKNTGMETGDGKVYRWIISRIISRKMYGRQLQMRRSLLHTQHRVLFNRKQRVDFNTRIHSRAISNSHRTVSL